MFSFLPLAHLMQRMLEMMAFAVGMRVGYYSGNISMIFEDMKELQPTILICVPRILNKIHEKVGEFLVPYLCIMIASSLLS